MISFNIKTTNNEKFPSYLPCFGMFIDGGGNLLAQNGCGTTLDSATYAVMRQEVMDMMRNKRTLSDCTDPYYDCPDDEYLIPVVFHVVQDQSDAFHFPISDATLKTLIADLNRMYAGTHPSQSIASIDPDFYPLFAGDTRIKFVLAAVDPDGNPHSGIERRTTDKTGFRNDFYDLSPDVALSPTNSDFIIKYEANGGLDAWPRTEFLNIWIGDIYDYTPGSTGGFQPPHTAPSLYGI
ncbi:MAG: hypothetical protein EAZ57_10775 [Cytophagales bacterium]|nr:MAG: hypothetical protein EAZ67_11375 [Cytophagales bacterium]TAF59558.1 MAG: hypothetical protein EAZ57_10775 [Cytophagales bacterium]